MLRDRNYHFNPALFETYKEWTKAEAIRILPSNSCGSLVSTHDAPVVNGAPQDRWLCQHRGSSDGDPAQRNDVLPLRSRLPKLLYEPTRKIKAG